MFVVCLSTQCLFKGKGSLKYSRELLFALALFSIQPYFQEKELGQRAIIYQLLIKIGGRVFNQAEISRPEYRNTEQAGRKRQNAGEET